ncbi:MAG: YdcF family protein [Eubacteriaceae bacterium]|jgi:uncharacterized SAM-binding protein YcdF (DUF218 family)|nr:YdcF family protein [Eubacteriaceae bacterium]
MVIKFFPLFFGIVFIISFIREKRRFRNAVYLLFFLCSAVIAVLYCTRNAAATTIMSALLLLLVPLGILAVSILFIAAGVQSIRREGLRLPNCLSILLVLAVWGGSFFSLYAISNPYINTIWAYLAVLVIIMLCYLGFTFTALFLYSLLYRYMPKNMDCDFIIVHGAGLLKSGDVTPLLAGRLDKGIDVFHKSGDRARIIVSGGQGADEVVSEAFAMKKYLLEKEIPEHCILMEDRSTTTYENMLYCKELIDQITDAEERTDYRCIFVTSDYHVFRTGTYARRVGLKGEGVGSRTSGYYYPNAFIREYAAIMVRFKFVPIVLFLIWAAGVYMSTRPYN